MVGRTLWVNENNWVSSHCRKGDLWSIISVLFYLNVCLQIAVIDSPGFDRPFGAQTAVLFSDSNLSVSKDTRNRGCISHFGSLGLLQGISHSISMRNNSRRQLLIKNFETFTCVRVQIYGIIYACSPLFVTYIRKQFQKTTAHQNL